MRLCEANLPHLDRRIQVPTYDRSDVGVGIVHFGVGGFHRAHQAMYLDTLMNSGSSLDWGICGVGVMPADLDMFEALAPQDFLYSLMTRRSGEEVEVRVIGSLVNFLYAPSSPEAVLETLCNEKTRIVSLTVTEGGYNLDPVTGHFVESAPAVQAELASGRPTTMFGYVVEALRRRRSTGTPPFTVLSCDNLQGNGAVARSCIVAFASLVDEELAGWIEEHVAFPSSMVDRITPTTTPDDRAELSQMFDLEDAWPVVTEAFTQWVVEDDFVDGRPDVHRVGVQFTNDVAPYERMKLRLLNAGHQALAYSGCLAGYDFAHEAMTDAQIVQFLTNYMNHEARPTLGDIPGVDLDLYIQTLLERFANPEIRDSIARLCAYTSDRIPKWVVPVIRENLQAGRRVAGGATIIASWAHYTEGTDDQGRPIDVVDALRDDLVARAHAQRSDPLAFILNRDLFGDLVDEQGFVDEFVEALKLFTTVGARETLEMINNSIGRELLE